VQGGTGPTGLMAPVATSDRTPCQPVNPAAKSPLVKEVVAAARRVRQAIRGVATVSVPRVGTTKGQGHTLHG